MSYIKKEIADKMSAVKLCEVLLQSLQLFYTPYADDEQQIEKENGMRLELIECIKEKILSGNA